MKLSDLNLHAIGNTIQIAGAVFVGEGKALLCMFPNDRGEVTSGEHKPFLVQGDEAFQLHTLDMDPEDWQTFLRQTDLLETEVLTKASDGTLAKAILRKSQRHIETGVQWAVWRRDKFACVYCGNDDVPLTVDHLVCWEQGGPSTLENLVSADKKCNRTRGNLSYSDWLEHPYYKKVSANLTEAQREENRHKATTLAAIPLRIHARSR